MTPTRERVTVGTPIDTGTGSSPSPRSDTRAYEGPPDLPAGDTGIGSPVAKRPDLQGSAFIPPLWL